MHSGEHEHGRSQDCRANGKLPAPGDFGLKLLEREEVDANHRSPGRRIVRPAATAKLGAASSQYSRSIFLLILKLLNGSLSRTGTPMRSSSKVRKPISL